MSLAQKDIHMSWDINGKRCGIPLLVPVGKKVEEVFEDDIVIDVPPQKYPKPHSA
ncbi:MAG: hypothetical protein Q7S47_02845 [bacterium]|nr:hypothetical protein [bacterium]